MGARPRAAAFAMGAKQSVVKAAGLEVSVQGSVGTQDQVLRELQGLKPWLREEIRTLLVRARGFHLECLGAPVRARGAWGAMS